MGMNTNSVYQTLKWYLILKYYTLRNLIPKKCFMCLKYHSDDKDVFECYSEYLYRYSYSKEVVDIGQSIDKLQSDVDLIKKSKYGKKSGLKNNVFENF